MKPTMFHSLERTSPKGQAFIGRCVQCGKEGLSAYQAAEECSNPLGITQDEALIESITGPTKAGYISTPARRRVIKTGQILWRYEGIMTNLQKLNAEIEALCNDSELRQDDKIDTAALHYTHYTIGLKLKTLLRVRNDLRLALGFSDKLKAEDEDINSSQKYTDSDIQNYQPL